ncbi:MAG: 16S rRNA (guanine(527)-N(7))-methyltransferase RsmG [Clostridia bacterium]
MLRETILKGLQEWELDDREKTVDKLVKFSEQVLERNEVMDLTAITDPYDFATKHILDSLSLNLAEDFDCKKVIDIGCGAGFPSMPMKLYLNSIQMTMVDSLKKRIDFLNEIGADLKNFEAIHARAEELAQNKKYREKYDIAVSRAVAPLSVLCELSLPFVKVGGLFLALKSVNCDEEIENSHEAIEKLGGMVEDIYDYAIPTTDIVHRIVIITKVENTPKKFPRKFNQIKSKPL